MKRGDVVLTFVPNVGSSGGVNRPSLVVQSNQNNGRLNETIIAAITSNISRVHEDHQLLVDTSTPDGKASGVTSQFGRPLRTDPHHSSGGRPTDHRKTF